MNCHAAKKHIPLFVGGEISASKSGRIRRHLEACPACRAEAEEIERSRRAVRGMAGAGADGDWSPAEWNRMIRAITATPGERRTRAASMKLRPALAGALGVILMAGLILVQKELRRPAAPEVGVLAVIGREAQPVVPSPAPTKNPDVTSVTIVSPDSGLKIQWFYNKKFEWQGFGK
jgi:predicted anti-sigma-YlaC factor YlaD